MKSDHGKNLDATKATGKQGSSTNIKMLLDLFNKLKPFSYP